jgi:SAM-dependent methyltransferase
VDARGVLDVGCGTGSTTLAVARRLGGKARCVGIDLSQQMITVARARAAHEGVPVSFICADAQTYAFEPDGFDLLISRFGVMFFNDPVQAFANLRSAAKPGANLRFIAWRSDAENPFMTTAERAAAPLLPDLPPRRPDAPGQFAFANDRRVRAILEASGWTHIGIRPIDVACSLSEEELSQYVTRLGPVGIYLQAADEATREKVGAVVRGAFDEYVMDGEARFTAACWMGEAKAPSGA